MDEVATSPRRAADAPEALDLRGLKCPMPVLRTRKALRRLAEGRTLRVLTTDPLAAIDLPHLVREDGHRLTETARETDGSMLFVIVKRAGQARRRDRQAGDEGQDCASPRHPLPSRRRTRSSAG